MFRKSLYEGSEIKKVQLRPLPALLTLKYIQIFSMVSLCSEQWRLKYQNPVLSFFTRTTGCHVVPTKDKNTKTTTSIKSRNTAWTLTKATPLMLESALWFWSNIFYLQCPCILQQDNAKAHSAHITKAWLKDKSIQLLLYCVSFFFNFLRPSHGFSVHICGRVSQLYTKKLSTAKGIP